MQKTISVIIPIYNRAFLLQEAVESVLSQTIIPLEILIINDGSTDAIESVVENMWNTHKNASQIRLITIKHCGMPGRVRNIGIIHARGDYIAFLDSDDIWLPKKLELQLNAIQEHNICHTREIWLRNNKEISQKGQNHKRMGLIFCDALKKCIIGPSTVLLHKSIFSRYGMFREDLEIAEDYELWLRICEKEYISYVDMPLIVKRDRDDTQQLSKKFTYIEYFRIQALQPLVKNKVFSEKNTLIAQQVLQEKLIIWNKGAEKRNNATYISL